MNALDLARVLDSRSRADGEFAQHAQTIISEAEPADFAKLLVQSIRRLDPPGSSGQQGILRLHRAAQFEVLLEWASPGVGPYRWSREGARRLCSGSVTRIDTHYEPRHSGDGWSVGDLFERTESRIVEGQVVKTGEPVLTRWRVHGQGAVWLRVERSRSRSADTLWGGGLCLEGAIGGDAAFAVRARAFELLELGDQLTDDVVQAFLRVVRVAPLAHWMLARATRGLNIAVLLEQAVRCRGKEPLWRLPTALDDIENERLCAASCGAPP